MNAGVVALALLSPAAPPAPAPDGPDVKGTVRTGLKWLAEQQKADGSWALSDDTAPTRVTAVAGLALLMEGSTLKSGTYAPNLRKAVEWFEKKTAAVPSLGRDRDSGGTITRDHAHALLFLVSVCDVDDDPERAARLTKIVDRAIAEALKAQTARGGWTGSLGAGNNTTDTSENTADVLHALFAARRCGFKVPHKVTSAGLAYLDNATTRTGGLVASPSGELVRYGNDGRGAHRTGTYNAAAVALMADGERPGALPRWVKYTAPESREQFPAIRAGGAYIVLQQFHAARACYLLGENGHRRLDPNATGAEQVQWSAHRARLFSELKQAQTTDGYWVDRTSGPTYPTALALISLQLDNGLLTAFSR